MVSRVLVLCVAALAAATGAQAFEGQLIHEEVRIYDHGSVRITTGASDTTAESPVQAIAKAAGSRSSYMMPVIVDNGVLVRDYDLGGMNGNIALDPMKNELAAQAASDSSDPRTKMSSGVVVLCGVLGTLAAVLMFAALVVRHDRAVRENTLTSDEIFDIEVQSNASEAEEEELEEADESSAQDSPVERLGIQEDDVEPSLLIDEPTNDDEQLQADEDDGTNEYVASPGHIAKLFLMMVGDML